MSCPENRKTALWGLLRWEGWHRWKRYRIDVDFSQWDVEYRCETCGARKVTHWVKDEDLIRWGYDIEDLREKRYVLCKDLEPRSPDAPPPGQPPEAEK